MYGASLIKEACSKDRKCSFVVIYSLLHKEREKRGFEIRGSRQVQSFEFTGSFRTAAGIIVTDGSGCFCSEGISFLENILSICHRCQMIRLLWKEVHSV